jgi:signal transduction histidine kinase
MHLQAPADAGLVAVLRACAPDLRVESAPFQLQAWLLQVQAPALDGVVLDVESLTLADVRLVLATLERDRRPWLLALVGDRGLVGCEALLGAPRTQVLPKPWTPSGVATALRGLRDGPRTAAGASDAFLAGLVEGLRDPLTSLGGYLQLMEHTVSAEGGDLLRPASDAARSLERQIECLYLATAELRLRPERLDLRPFISEVLTEARREDARVTAEIGGEALTVDADPRFLRAALDVARLLLMRFGPGGALLLRAARDADGVTLGWEAATEVAPAALAAGRTVPPPFLPELFERLAARVPARPLLDRLRGAVPVRVALRWTAVKA